MLFSGITHVALNVTDMDKALEFYCGTLGLKKVFDIFDGNNNPWIVYVKVSDRKFIELFHNGVKDREKAYDNSYIGYHHMCLSVGDIQALTDSLHKKGALAGIKPHLNRENNLSIWLEDSDGNGIEVVQYSPESPLMQTNQDPGFDYARKGFNGIAHVAFVVGDMDKTLEYYSRLGFDKVYAIDAEQGNPQINFLRVNDGTYLELVGGGTVKMPKKPHSAGCSHVCLEGGDIRDAVRQLEKKDVPIDLRPKVGADGNWQAWIDDPESNRYELMTLDPACKQLHV